MLYFLMYIYFFNTNFDMGIVTFQMVLTLIAATVLQKIVTRWSFGKYILSGKYYRFLPPSEEELLRLSGKTSSTSKSQRRKTFHGDTRQHCDSNIRISKHDLDLQLRFSRIQHLDLLNLPFYSEFDWLLNVTFVTVSVFCISSLYELLFPVKAASDCKISIIWYFILASLCLSNMTRITAVYFKQNNSSGERSVCICIGALSFLVTMILLVFNPILLDVGIDESFRNFSLASEKLFSAQGITLQTSRSPALLYCTLSAFFAFLSALLAFPSFRFARMYVDASRMVHSVRQKASLGLAVISPICCLLWLKPLADALRKASPVAISFFEINFDCLRIILTIVAILTRVAVAKPCLQAYLNLAVRRKELWRHEVGKLTVGEIRHTISSIYSYFAVVAIQFYAPLLFQFSVCCLLKELGNYSCFTTSYCNISEVPYIKKSTLFENKFWHLSHMSNIFNETVNCGLWNFVLFITCLNQLALPLIAILGANFAYE
ncbi:Transmembrane protein [Trichinella pseudospiralis]|uniref:Transmembrane protein n=1 Tax=Trichinella pseudospiralis TaxID=6337 RepID=A0A0V0XIW9_TRIPS|nr:Transmembrane protein [Trichinella pseudospiralis]KRY70303.1 Transmembrane protein [Trichinella pseudospiralis]KRZ29811.1 Transmembrane protein [Trichinella pseudospiralis]